MLWKLFWTQRKRQGLEVTGPKVGKMIRVARKMSRLANIEIEGACSSSRRVVFHVVQAECKMSWDTATKTGLSQMDREWHLMLVLSGL